MIIDSIHHQQSEQLTRNSALEKKAGTRQAPAKESADPVSGARSNKGGNSISVYSRRETQNIEYGSRGQFIDTRI